MLRTLTPALFSAFLLGATATAGQAQTVIPIEDAQRGTMVTVAGVVERITDEDEFILTDESDSIRVYVGPNWVPAQVGDSVTVQGFVDNDLLRRELYARTLTMPDGSVVTFDLRDE